MNPTQLEIPQTLTIASALGKRRVKVSSLRPGDWVRYRQSWSLPVFTNSAKLQRICLDGEKSPEWAAQYWDYAEFAYCFSYLGKGRPRRWLRYLPRWIAKHFCPYAPPTRK